MWGDDDMNEEGEGKGGGGGGGGGVLRYITWKRPWGTGWFAWGGASHARRL